MKEVDYTPDENGHITSKILSPGVVLKGLASDNEKALTERGSVPGLGGRRMSMQQYKEVQGKRDVENRGKQYL